MNFIIDDELLENIKDRVDIVDLISGYVQLKKSGSNYSGLCPFHNEKTPSFSVSPSKGIFKCFGCGAGGDHISFVMKKENLNFREAVEFLADKYNIELKEFHGKDFDKEKKLKDRIYSLNKEAAIFYMQALAKSKQGYSYLTNRGIDEYIIKTFGLGFAPEGWDNLYKHLLQLGFTEDEMVEANLISKSKRGTYIDRFRNRIMYPILDSGNRVIAFGGRTMDSSIPKYLNSSDTIVFNKGDNLYNINKIKEASSNKIVLVEGYMDVISLYKSGINYSVASLGTAFTESQAKLIKRYAEDVYICYDSDQAGIKATDRAIDILVSQNIKPKIIRLEKGMDPDDFVRKYGKLAFELEMTNAISYLDYKIANVKQKYNLSATEGIVGFTTEVANILLRLKNPIERDLYVDKISKEYGIKAESINSYIELKFGENKRNIQNKQRIVQNEKIKKPNDFNFKNSRIRTEELLIAYMIHSRDIFNIVNDNIESYELNGMRERDIFEIIKDHYNNSELVTLEDEFRSTTLVNPEYKDKILNINIDSINSSNIVKELIKNIKHFNLEDRRNVLLNQLKSYEENNNIINTDDLKNIIEELTDVNSKLNLPN